jgi:uroporphyrinogen-III synthase
MRLLVTRPEPEAGALARELRDLGHEPVLQPLLEFRPLDFDPAPLSSAHALVFTSGNGLRGLREKLDLSGMLDYEIFCVGSETERRLRAAGFDRVAAAAETAEELAAKIASTLEKGARLVHVTGEHQAFELAEALGREGLCVCTLRVYKMAARDAFDSLLAGDIKAGGIAGVILMSPRTAGIFVSLCRRHELLANAKALRYFCLAGSVAAKLEPLEAANVFVAAKPNRAALLALLATLPPAGHDLVKHDR